MNGYGIRYIYPKMPLMHNCIKSRWVAEKMIWVTAYQQGKSITQIAQEAHVSRHTLYKWLGRFKHEGIGGLTPKAPGVKTGNHPSSISKDLVLKMIKLNDEEGYGIRSIVHELKKENISVSHMTVYRYLVSRGRIIPKHKRRRKEPKLHVCDLPGEEMQLDVMHVDPLAGTEDTKEGKWRSRRGFHYQYTLVDDCTRVQYAKLFVNLSQDNTCMFLEEILSKTPFTVSCVRMDNGTEFQTKTRSFLKTRRINFIYNRPSRPDMNGKVERTHRIDTEEFYLKDLSHTFEERQTGLNSYLHHYNNKRPHWGFGMDGKTPLEKLQTFTQYQSVNLIV